MTTDCRSRGTRQIVGQVLCDNNRTLDLMRSLGFESKKVLDENIMEVVLDLQQPLRQPDA
jgi:acetyltransferase